MINTANLCIQIYSWQYLFVFRFTSWQYLYLFRFI